MIIGWVLMIWMGDGDGLQAGDSAFLRMDYETARRAYEQRLLQDSTDEALWRLCRLHLCMGDISASPAREDHYRKSVRYGESAVLKNPKSSPAHAWLAAALGSLAMRSDAREKVSFTRRIQFHCEESLKLNSRNDVALSILGSFYRELAKVGWLERNLASLLLGGLPKGSFEDSEKALQQAIAIAPNVMRHYEELGRLYLDWNRPREARHMFEVGITKPLLMASDRHRIQSMEYFLRTLR